MKCHRCKREFFRKPSDVVITVMMNYNQVDYSETFCNDCSKEIQISFPEWKKEIENVDGKGIHETMSESH